MTTNSHRFLRRSMLLNGLFAVEGGSMFLLDVVLAASLGLGARSDSLYAAWSLPLTIGRGAFQSLTNSLIGLFAEAEDDSVAYSQSVTVIGVLSLAAAALMSVTSRWWFPLSVPGADATTRQAGVPLAAILAWLIALLALAETQRAIYYRLERVTFPSLTRVFGALAAIVLILLAAQQQNLTLAAYGLVLGAAVEMVLGFVGLLWLGVRPRLAWPPLVMLRRMGRVVGLPLLGQGILIGGSTAERALASLLGPGTVTAITYANRIFQMLERFIFRGFVIATIQSYAIGLEARWRRDMRFLLLIAVPLFVVFAVMPAAIITIVFERGRFTAEATDLVALALRAYAPAILIVALNRIPYALAFARSKGRELMIFSLIFATTLIASEALLITLGLRVSAFGLAYLIAATVGTAWLFARVVNDLAMPRWSVDEVARLVVVALVALGGTALVTFAVGRLALDPALQAWVTVLAGGSSSVVLTVVAAWALHLPEVGQVSRLLRSAAR